MGASLSEEEDGIDLSRSAPVPIHCASLDHKRKQSLSIAEDSSLQGLSVDTVTKNITCDGDDEVDHWAGRSENSLANHDQVDLKDIYFRLKRKSQSYESLLDQYTEEDTGLKNVLHSTLTELARLSANLDGDSVFSESDDTGENDTSLINLDLTFSDHCSESSLHHSFFDASASSNNPRAQGSSEQ